MTESEFEEQMSRDSSTHYTMQFDVLDGKMGEFEALADEAVARVEADEPGCVAFRWDSSGSSVRRHARFADAAAMMAHLGNPAALEMFPKLMAIAALSNFDVHGDVSDEAKTRIESFNGAVYSSWKGFNR